jgi:hypothetical protein
VIVGHVVGAQRLDGEGEVHYLHGMPVPGRQVHYHAASDQVQLATVFRGELLDVAAHVADLK